jgi:flavodoxin
MTDTGRRAFLGLLGAAATGIGIAACTPGGGQNNGGSNSSGSGPALSLDGSRTLVSYFSMPETDDPNGMTEDEANSTHVVEGTVLGNTQYVAQLIQARLGTEIFRIETAEPMPLEHDTLIEQSIREQEENARPELKALIPDLSAYDTVFIGYPIWNYLLPSPVDTFLDQHDFNGKNIVLFSTHGGNGLADTVETITERLAGSSVNQNGFTISRDDMDQAESEVGSWLDSLA